MKARGMMDGLGYLKRDVTFECNTTLDAEGAIIVDSDCGIYNIIYKRPVLNADGKVCGSLYVHAPNCTFENGKYLVHPADENRTIIAYHQLCDLAKVPHGASCSDLFKALGDVLCPDGYKENPNREERRRRTK